MSKQANNNKNSEFSVNTHYLQGCRFDNWIRLLSQNKFHIDKGYRFSAFNISLMSLLLFPFAGLESLVFGRKIKKTVVSKAPVFIVGHWRSGTTHLLNVMCNDNQFGFMNSVSSFTHNYFLTLGPILERVQRKVLPEKRPMDNIEYTTQVPQEDVYAIGNLIPEAIIHMSVFADRFEDYIDTTFTDASMPSKSRERLKKTYDKMVKKMTYASKGKRMIFKSPDNTAKIDLLCELYPDAYFIHIYRNPYKVIISTIGLFRLMFPMFALQNFPEDTDYIEDQIIKLYKRVYTKYLDDKKRIAPGHLYEIKYEDFVASSMNEHEKIYSTFNLDISKSRKSIEK